MKAEYKEWLGIAPADWPVYLATVLVVAMYKVEIAMVNVGLAAVIIGLTVWSCFIGMKRDPDVSSFTNTVKKIAYPLCLLVAVGAIAVKFVKYS